MISAAQADNGERVKVNWGPKERFEHKAHVIRNDCGDLTWMLILKIRQVVLLKCFVLTKNICLPCLSII